MIDLPRKRVYLASAMFLWIIAYVALYAGAQLGFTPYLMGFNQLPPLLFATWCVFALLGGAAIIVGFKAFGYRESEIMESLVPNTVGEKICFVVLALSAGICEEIAFRGFMIPGLYKKTGSLIAAILISSAIFGIMHMHQRATGAVRAGLLGVVLAVPLVLSGSVYPSMTAHAIIDVVGGLWIARWLIK